MNRMCLLYALRYLWIMSSLWYLCMVIGNCILQSQHQHVIPWHPITSWYERLPLLFPGILLCACRPFLQLSPQLRVQLSFWVHSYADGVRGKMQLKRGAPLHVDSTLEELSSAKTLVWWLLNNVITACLDFFCMGVFFLLCFASDRRMPPGVYVFFDSFASLPTSWEGLKLSTGMSMKVFKLHSVDRRWG